MARVKTHPFLKESSYLIRHFYERERLVPARLAEQIGMDRSQFHREADPKNYGCRLSEGRVPALAAACKLRPTEVQSLYDALERDRMRAANKYTIPSTLNDFFGETPLLSIGGQVIRALRQIHWTYEVSSGEPLTDELLSCRMNAEEGMTRYLGDLGFSQTAAQWNQRALQTARQLQDRFHLMLFSHRSAMYLSSILHLHQSALHHLEKVVNDYRDVIPNSHFSAIFRDMSVVAIEGWKKGRPPEGESPLTYLRWAEGKAIKAGRQDELDNNRLHRAMFLLTFGKPKAALQLLEEYEIYDSAQDISGKIFFMFHDLRIRTEAGESPDIAMNQLDLIHTLAEECDHRVLLSDIERFRRRFE